MFLRTIKKISAGYLILLIIFSFASCGEECKFNSITTDSLPEGKVGKDYKAELGYDITCSFTQKLCEVEGDLPEGITMNTSGVFSGLPTKAGVYPFTVKMRMCFGAGAYEFTDCSEKTKKLEIKVAE